MKKILANFPLSQHKDLNAHDLCKELPSLTKERGKKKKKAWRGREEPREKDGKLFYYFYHGLFKVPMLGSLIM